MAKSFLHQGKTHLLLLTLLLLTNVYTLSLYQKDHKELTAIKKNPNLVAQQEAKDLVAKVGAIVQLPKDEQPTIATVTDVSKLQGQVFFTNAKNGDKVLIYVKAAKAYLYSVSMNKILEVAPITVNQNPAQVAGVKTETPTPAPKK